MYRLLTVLLMLGVVSACSPYRAIRKTNKDFVRLCESVTGGIPVVATNETEKAELRPRLISPGMQIAVNVEEDTSLNRSYTVPPGCTLEFPAIGRIGVCGLTTDELANKLREVLERDYFQKANVTVYIDSVVSPDRPGGGVVYIIGDVSRPGPLLLPREEIFTVTKGIIAAGGFTQFAKSTAVRVVRYCEDGKKYDTLVNVERIMTKGEFERDVPLRPNDWVIVGQKLISF